MVRLKRTDDILQGINKLDYLLKVSYFQRYKKNINGKAPIDQEEDEDFNPALRTSSGNTITSEDLNNRI